MHKVPILALHKHLADSGASPEEIKRATTRAKAVNAGLSPTAKIKRTKTVTTDTHEEEIDDGEPEDDDKEDEDDVKKKAIARAMSHARAVRAGTLGDPQSVASLLERKRRALATIAKHAPIMARIAREEAIDAKRAADEVIWRKQGVDPVKARALQKKQRDLARGAALEREQIEAARFDGVDVTDENIRLGKKMGLSLEQTIAAVRKATRAA